MGLGFKAGQAVAPVLLLLAVTAAAQDLHSIKSPDGQVEFRLFVSQSASGLPRIGYQVAYRNKLLLDTSFLGFDIDTQEPILGEKAGLMAWSEKPGMLTAQYMQDGSIGRRLDIEARVWNDGAAFRYVIPRSTPLEDIPIVSELTEFALPVKIAGPVTTPFTGQVPGVGWISVGEQGTAGTYPAMSLMRSEDEDRVLITHFSKTWESVTPLSTPWRVIGVGETREAALDNRRIKGEY